LRDHLGFPVPSPAVIRPLHDRFVHAVETFVDQNDVPLVTFERDQRKDDVAASYRAAFDADEGVVFVGVAQEKASSFKCQKKLGPQGGTSFNFSRQLVYVKHYYFYLQDQQWGPAFIKVGTYLPYPVRVYLNGHEWTKQQLRREGIAFESLDNGFRWCADPVRLQQVCDSLGPTDVQAFFDRWSQRLPWPLTPADRAAGYFHRLTIWQLEVSLTQVFRQPLWGRRFFEAVIRANLDLGRPDQVSLLFPIHRTRRTPPPPAGYRTRVITAGVIPGLYVAYKRSHVKQYFKEAQALRTETTINDPKDFQPNKSLHTLPKLRAIGHHVNTRLLEVEQLADADVFANSLFERLQYPTTTETGRRAAALRFGDPRVHALLSALCRFSHVPGGFRHRDLRPLVAGLLSRDLEAYSRCAMTYDLRRLRLHGLIERVDGTHRYTATPTGLRVAFFYTTLHRRLLQLGNPTSPDIPPPLRAAVRQLELALNKLWNAADLHSQVA
jgi:DNA-binding transcriptional ArsR family regulator